MKKFLSFIIIIGLLLFTILILIAHPFQSVDSPQAIKGEIELAEWSFKEKGPIKLKGEWELYEGQLLTPADFQMQEAGSTTQVPQMTGYLDPTATRSLQQWLASSNDEAIGSRTYRLHISLEGLTEKALALKLSNIRHSSVLYINGEQFGGHGVVSQDEEQYEPGNKGYDVYFEPHFVYNAINTVISLCHLDPPKAAQVLTDFSQYLRLVFDIESSLNEVPLRRELELVEVYVNIERARFGDKYKLELDVPKHLLDVMVPSFCIQPLVENAIKHGLYRKPEGGTITVAASADKGMLTLVISDDGVGMSEQKLQQLLDQQFSSGVGFGNVQKRIRHFRDSSFAVKSEPGAGTSVAISFAAAVNAEN